jgi:GMP synthase-like glutamine amidotransferase
MRLQVFQHVRFEDPGLIRHWAAERGHSIQTTHWYAGDSPPPTDAYDLLLIMGGPMGVEDTEIYSWLEIEKRAITRSLDHGCAAIGICLGAQLLADALGADITTQPQKEIGWFEVERCLASNGPDWLEILPDRFPAFHWHGQTFTLPSGAVQIARSAACELQAFTYGDRVLGLQFHLESDTAAIERLIQHCPKDLVSGGPFVQSAAEMLNPTAISIASQICFDLLDAFYDTFAQQLQ